MATYDLPEVYVAILESPYRIIAIGETVTDATTAACKAYRKSTSEGGANYPIYDSGRMIRTNADIRDYFGVNVYGPMRLGEGVTE